MTKKLLESPFDGNNTILMLSISMSICWHCILKQLLASGHLPFWKGCKYCQNVIVVIYSGTLWKPVWASCVGFDLLINLSTSSFLRTIFVSKLIFTFRPALHSTWSQLKYYIWITSIILTNEINIELVTTNWTQMYVTLPKEWFCSSLWSRYRSIVSGLISVWSRWFSSLMLIWYTLWRMLYLWLFLEQKRYPYFQNFSCDEQVIREIPIKFNLKI